MVFHRPSWRLDPTACPSTPRAYGAETYRASPRRHPQVRKNIEPPAPFRPPWCGIRIEVQANFDPNGAETISGIVVGFGGSCRTKVITLDFPASTPLSQCATSRAVQKKEKHRYLGTWTLFAEYSWVVSGCKDARCREQLLGRTLYARDVSAVLPRVDQSLRAALKFDFRRRFACPRSRFHTRPLWHRRAS